MAVQKNMELFGWDEETVATKCRMLQQVGQSEAQRGQRAAARMRGGERKLTRLCCSLWMRWVVWLATEMGEQDHGESVHNANSKRECWSC